MTRDPFATSWVAIAGDYVREENYQETADRFGEAVRKRQPMYTESVEFTPLGAPLLRIFIPGHPVPKGSMAPIINRRGKFCGMREDNEDSKPWRRAMVDHLRRTGHADRMHTGPVAVALTFHVQQKATEGTGRVWPSHDVPHPVAHDTGDLDKYTRNVLDAIQPAKDARDGAGLIKDDSQVVGLVARKQWAGESINGAPRVGVEIELRKL